MDDNDIIKAFDILDKFEFFGGQKAGRLLWFNKPADIQEKDIGEFNRDIDFLKAFINRQKAENERLQHIRAELSKENEEQDRAIINALHRMKEIRAEAVKEFAEKLKRQKLYLRACCCEVRACLSEEYIDNIVEEMTESKNE